MWSDTWGQISWGCRATKQHHALQWPSRWPVSSHKLTFVVVSIRCSARRVWLQGISGPQRFQIHKAYGAVDRLPSAHTCFNQLDLLEYETKEQLRERLLLAMHEGSEGFGFG